MKCPVCHETILGNPDSCYKCGADLVAAMEAEHNKELERLNAQKQAIFDNLMKLGYDSYYEYKTLVIDDNIKGGIDVYKMTEQINEMAKQGWRLKTVFTNEYGKDSTQLSVGAFTSGVNATMEQTVIIFERKIINT